MEQALEITGMVVGWVVLILVCCYSIPQLVTVLKTKNTKALSIPAYVLFIFSNLVMMIWGIGNACRGIEQGIAMFNVIMVLLPNVILNALNFCVNTTCLSLKIKNLSKAKKLGIDELELAKMLLKQKKQKAKAKAKKAGK